MEKLGLLLPGLRLLIVYEIEREVDEDDYDSEGSIQSEPDEEELEITHRICLRKGLFKGLVSAQIYSLSRPYWISALKRAKELSKLS